MNTPVMVTAVICITVLVMDIVSEITSVIKMKMRMKYGKRREKDAD